MRQIIFLLFLLPVITYGQTQPSQEFRSPFIKFNKKAEFAERLKIPGDTTTLPAGATIRDTSRLIAFGPNGNLYKLWNGVWEETGGETSITYDFPSIYIDSLGVDSFQIRILQLIKDSAGTGGGGGLPTQYNGQDTANILWYNLKQYIIRARGQSWQESLIKVDSAGAYVLGNDSVVIGGRFDTGRVVIRFRGMESASNGDSVLALNNAGNLIKVAKADLLTFGYGLSGNGSSGSPLRIDSATLRPDYIRNQYTAKESKSAWIERLRADSSFFTRVGIGTTSVNKPLVVSSTGGDQVDFIGTTTRPILSLYNNNNGTNLTAGAQLGSINLGGRFGGIDNREVSQFQGYYEGDGTTRTGGAGISLYLNGTPFTRFYVRNNGYSGHDITNPNSYMSTKSISVAANVITSTTSVDSTYSSVFANASSGAITVTLPTPTGLQGRIHTVKKIDSTLNAVTIISPSGLVDGMTSHVLQSFGESVMLQSTGNSWRIIAENGSPASETDWSARRGASYFNDFMNFSFSDGYLTTLAVGTGSTIGRTAATTLSANRPGITSLQTGTTTTGYALYRTDGGNINESIIFGSGAHVFETDIRIPALSTVTDRYNLLAGFGDIITVTNQVDGIYFLYDEGGVQTGSAASANWQVVTASNSSRTFTTTSVPVAVDTWYRLRIEVNPDASSVQFFINGTLVRTETATIPSGTARATSKQITIRKSAGTTNVIALIDYLYWKTRFNTPRY